MSKADGSLLAALDAMSSALAAQLRQRPEV